MMVGRLLSYWEANFSGAMLNFQGVVGLLCTPVGVIANRSPPALVNKVLVSCWFCHVFFLPYMKTCFKFFWIMCILEDARKIENMEKFARCSGIASTMVAQLHG